MGPEWVETVCSFPGERGSMRFSELSRESMRLRYAGLMAAALSRVLPRREHCARLWWCCGLRGLRRQADRAEAEVAGQLHLRVSSFINVGGQVAGRRVLPPAWTTPGMQPSLPHLLQSVPEPRPPQRPGEDGGSRRPGRGH
ncbi:hypothetical protein O3P69_002863 [Scylla paramamosain]|uniref:Uncharacterized protein n=1 Tax=Scylla paramamosain TaxID=85552 RepID=A0AAW0URK6_SCYPA